MSNNWIKADSPPETDDYILLSFDEFSGLEIGRYESGAYYVGDDDLPCDEKYQLTVNAWQPLPKPYRED